MTNPRDWDKEMADIDKLMAADKAPAPGGLPSGGAVAKSGGASPAPAARSGVGVASRPRDAFGVWLKVLLGALGGAALFYWPYGKSCGPMLYAYLVGVLAVSAAGGGRGPIRSVSERISVKRRLTTPYARDRLPVQLRTAG